MAKAGKQKRRRPPRSKKPIRRRKHGSLIIYYIIFAVLLTGTLVVLFFTVFFPVEEIRVVGASHYTDEELIDATEIQIGDKLLRVPFGEIEGNLLEKYPYLDTVKVRWKLFPTAVEVDVTECEPIAAVEEDGQYVLITLEGKVLERGFFILPSNVLLFRGIDISEKEPGEYVGTWKAETAKEEETPEEKAERQERNELAEAHAEEEADALMMLRYLLEAVEETGIGEVTNLNRVNRYSMEVMYENRMLLQLGSVLELPYKLRYAKEIMDNRLHPDAHGILNLAEASRTSQVTYTPAEGYRRDDGSPLSEPPYRSDVQPEEGTPTLGMSESVEPGEDTGDELAEAG